MENKYYCECCNYDAKVKSSYDKHIKTKKHKNVSKSYPSCIQMLPSVTPMLPLEKKQVINCKYCNKTFKYRSGLSRHIKYSCKKNEDEDLKELVKLMNEKMDILNKENQEIKREINKRDKQIVKLSQKLQINNIHNIQNIQNNNIQILNYKDTDLSHLSNNDYESSIKRINNCVKTLTEKIHYNPEKPENMNIYISNLKNDYITVYENGEWLLKNCLDDIINHKEILLEEWLDKEQDNYPELRDKFEIYLNNKDNNNSILNNIKEDIKLMMYNNRNQIKTK